MIILMHKFLFYNKLIIFLYMFQALLCSSTGGQNCIIQHLLSSHSVGGGPVHRKATYKVWRYSSMTAALEWGEWSEARPGRTLPPRGKTRYPFYRRLDGSQSRSGQAENLVPTGIRFRTVQPVAQSLYLLSYPVHKTCMYLSTKQKLWSPN